MDGESHFCVELTLLSETNSTQFGPPPGLSGMLATLLVIAGDSSGHVPDPETTADYVFLYGGLTIVAAAVLLLGFRSGREGRARRRRARQRSDEFSR